MTESVPPDPTPGRHGGGDGSAGLSAAELIARARAAAGDAAPARPSRRSRRAADEPAVRPVEADADTGTRNDVHPHADEVEEPATVALSEIPAPPAQQRHLTVVEAPPADRPGVVDLPGVADIPVPTKSRAGRNLPAAIGVGVGLAAVVLATLTLYRPSFVYLIAVAVVIGIYELVTAIATVEARAPLVPLLAGGVAMQAAAWFRGPDGLVGSFLLTVLGLVIWRLADGVAGYRRDVGAGVYVALYVPFLAGFAALSVHAGDGVARIVIFILVVVCNDTGGYTAGVLFGRHPMAPTVSPKKSWEGMAGSVIAGAIAGTLMMTLCFHHAWWQGIVFGVALVVTATLGDLGESMIKRDLGIKDMGHLLPGHGGIMDRLDSLLPCAPVAYLLLSAFLR